MSVHGSSLGSWLTYLHQTPLRSSRCQRHHFNSSHIHSFPEIPARALLVHFCNQSYSPLPASPTPPPMCPYTPALCCLQASMDWHCHADAEAGPKPKGSGRGGLTGACLRVIALNASHVMQTKVTHRGPWIHNLIARTLGQICTMKKFTSL